jgi:hypothetical protein
MDTAIVDLAGIGPIPAGVPVMMTSPGRSVMTWDTK